MESDLGVIVDQVGTGAARPTHLRFLRIRRDTPFKLSAARELAPVKVSQNGSITESTWAAIWHDHFLAAVSSRDAPGHKKLTRYFHATSGQSTHIVNLFRPDMVQRLREMGENGGLRMLQVNVRTSMLEHIEFHMAHGT